MDSITTIPAGTHITAPCVNQLYKTYLDNFTTSLTDSIPGSVLTTSVWPEEQDTYTLIPKGKRVWIDRNDGPVNDFFVEHNQTGNTILWRGTACSNYHEFIDDLMSNDEEDIYDSFETFFEWSPSQKKSWKTKELARIKREHPYYNPEVNELVKAFDDIFSVKENNMQYNTAVAAIAQQPSEAADQRKYLIRRLSDVEYKKLNEFHTTFKMNPVSGPRTLKDLVEKIKSGDFIMSVDDYDDEKEFYSTSCLVDYIRWSKEKPDSKGYDAAKKALAEAKKNTLDTITIMSPEEGLKALQAFEAQTFH